MSQKIIANALKLVQPIGDLYIVKMKACDLIKISRADVRAIENETYRETYLGIQRRLDGSRERNIADYVQTFDATFPTSIVIYIDEDNVQLEEHDGFIKLIINQCDDKIAKIIDGQHRLAGLDYAIKLLEKEKETELPFDREIDEKLQNLYNFDLSVTLLIGMDIAEQANIFAKVNLTQTKVNKSLVYDLEEYSKIRTPYKTAHNVVLALNYNSTSPFYKKIKRLGYVELGDELLSQQTFVETLTRYFISTSPSKDREEMARYHNIKKISEDDLQKLPFRKLFIDNRDLDIAKIVFNYFCAVKNKWPIAWGNKKYLLSKNNSFRALMKYLRYIYPEMSQKAIIPTIDMFSQKLEHFEIKDADFTSHKLKQGESGMNDFYKYLCGFIPYSELIQDTI